MCRKQPGAKLDTSGLHVETASRVSNSLSRWKRTDQDEQVKVRLDLSSLGGSDVT